MKSVGERNKSGTHRSKTQRQQIEAALNDGQSNPWVMLRGRILLLLDRSQPTQYTDAQIAAIVGCSVMNIFNARRRLLETGLEETLSAKPIGPKTPYKVTAAHEAEITWLASSAPPEGKKRWSRYSLAAKIAQRGRVEEISPATVARILQKQQNSPENAIPPGIKRVLSNR